MKAKKKQSSIEYAPVTEAELREMAEVHAQAAMYCELCELAKLSWYSIDAARRHYVEAEAYERWADELKWSNFVYFDASDPRLVGLNKTAKKGNK